MTENDADETRFRIGTDIGGTCTDTTIVDDHGHIELGKDLTTYPDFSAGIMDSLRDAIADRSESLTELLQRTDLFLHATSVGENALFEREGARTGLLTTAGFEETLHATRGGYGRWSGLPYEQVKDIVATEKPTPLIPQSRIRGIQERSYRDRSIREVSSEEIVDAVEALRAEDIEALGVCFLWSFTSPDHEREVKSLLEARYPDLYVCISSDISPTRGEYERTATTVLNAYLGPAAKTYLENLGTRLSEHGFGGELLVMFAHGGLVSRADAIDRPVGLVESGPVAGLLGSQFIAGRRDITNVISTDMGGTTFKVGVIDHGRIEYADEPMVGRHHYQFPKRDIHSIAVAGGSIVHLEAGTGIPRVGPESAGSDPGPVCYGRGGEQPTVTDVDLIQGYFSPSYFLDGSKEMTPDRAYAAFEEQIATPLGGDVESVAADIYTLINSKITDLLRERTVEKGIDPRGFTIVSIGGAAGMHAASYARQLNVPQVLVPYTASVNSAMGLLATDVTHEHIEARELRPPFELSEINSIFEELTGTAREKLADDGFEPEEIELERSVSLRYQRQVHELLTPVTADGSLNDEDLQALLDRFERQYERRYGEGSAFKKGGVEMTEFRVRGIGSLETPDPRRESFGDGSADRAVVEERSMAFEPVADRRTAPVYDFEELEPGDEFSGPAVIVTPITTIVVNPGDIAAIDPYRNVRIDIAASSDSR